MRNLTFYLAALTAALSNNVQAAVSSPNIGTLSVSDATFSPEPSTFLLLSAGLVGLYFARRHAQAKQ